VADVSVPTIKRGNRRNDNGCGSRRSRAHRPDLAETARTRVDTQPARYSPTI
jgi:hypothetical protein